MEIVERVSFGNVFFDVVDFEFFFDLVEDVDDVDVNVSVADEIEFIVIDEHVNFFGAFDVKTSIEIFEVFEVVFFDSHFEDFQVENVICFAQVDF